MPSISETAQQAGLSVDTLRYYEKIGLLPRIAREPSGHRRYDEADLTRLHFIQRAQRCNFSLGEIRQLLEFRSCRDAARPEVARLAEEKLQDIQRRMIDLERLQQELGQLLELCHGSDRGCPIIDVFDTPE